MKRDPESRAGRASVLVAVALSLAVAGCASVPRQTAEPEPVACTDASLVALRAVHPDSLSERGWQQLQNLERECSLAREAAAREGQGWSDGHHAWWMASGLGMGLMMLLMWSPW